MAGVYYPGETANGRNAASFRSGDIRDGVFNQSVTVAGTVTIGDIFTVTMRSTKIVANINSPSVPASYTAVTGDDLNSVASGIVTAINGAGARGGIGAASNTNNVAGQLLVVSVALLGVGFTVSTTSITATIATVGPF